MVDRRWTRLGLSGAVRRRRQTALRARSVAALLVGATLVAGCGPTTSPDEPAAGTITVTTTEDEVAEDGRCSLREAITAANSDTASGGEGECAAGKGHDRIEFDLEGPSDFTVKDRAGYTIRPRSALPRITAPVTIDGYSQRGASPNSAPSPQPLDGTLLVQLDGEEAGPDAFGLVLAPGSDDSVITGLVISRFGDPGRGGGVLLNADGIHLLGNYIGTDPTGRQAQGNGFAGFTSDPDAGADGAVIGGLEPAHRNLISGNGSSAGYPHEGARIQGNYLGTDVDGTAAIPNATVNDSGALSIDFAPGVLVGGDEPGAANVISGNASHGVAPHDSPGLVVAGNLIGTDWTGSVALPNLVGVSLSADQTGSRVGGHTSGSGNVISGNLLAGIADGSTGGLRIEGNTVGLDATGTSPIPNPLGIASQSDGVVGGTVGRGNVVAGNTAANVLIRGSGAVARGLQVSGNLIGTDRSGEVRTAITDVQGAGVWICGDAVGNVIGGEVGNRIAGNRGFGIGVSRHGDVQNPPAAPEANLIVGNEIFATRPGDVWPGAPGTAIDLFSSADTTEPYHPLDALPESLDDLGPNPTVPGRVGGSANEYVTPPAIVSAVRDGDTLTVRLDPSDPGAGGRHRVDLYLNVAGEPGAARFPVGHASVDGSGVQQISVELPDGIGADAVWLTATTTRLHDGTVGSTGELSSPFEVR